jgi:hypothetical protein
VLPSGIEDQSSAVVLDASFDVEEAIDLMPLLFPLRPIALSVLRDAGPVSGRLRAGGRRSHVLKIDPSSRSP